MIPMPEQEVPSVPEVKTPRKVTAPAPEVPEVVVSVDPLAEAEAQAQASGFKTQRIGTALRVDY